MPTLKQQRIQSKSADLAANLRSITSSLSNSDNAFATAKNIGKLRASNAPVTIRAKGTVGKSDRVDFFQFTIEPGANFPISQSIHKIFGGTVKIAVYAKHPLFTNNQLVLGGTRRSKKSSSFFNDQPTYNESSIPITAYIKVSVIGKKTVKYDLKEIYTPSSDIFF